MLIDQIKHLKVEIQMFSMFSFASFSFPPFS